MDGKLNVNMPKSPDCAPLRSHRRCDRNVTNKADLDGTRLARMLDKC